MNQLEVISYIKEAIKEIETKNETDYHQVMMYFSSIYANYNLLITNEFQSKEEYEFFKEYLNRSHDYLLNIANEIRVKNERYSQNNFLPLRIILSTMLFGIERRENNLVM